MSLFEPLRGMYIVVSWFGIMLISPILTKRVPVLSDIFVFSYPFFFLGVYIYAIIREWRYLNKKKQDPKASEANKKTFFWNVSKTFWIKSFLLNVFFVAVISMGINIFIQQFFFKERPYVFFSNQNESYITTILQQKSEKKKLVCFFGICNFSPTKEASSYIFEGFRSLLAKKTNHQTLLHAFLPKTSFPSDHAVLSFAIAVSMLYGSLKTKKIKETLVQTNNFTSFFISFPHFLFFLFGILFFIFAIIMGVGRIMSGVHWPTDIIAGVILGTIVGLLFFQQSIRFFIQKSLIVPIITCEQKISLVIKLFLQKIVR